MRVCKSHGLSLILVEHWIGCCVLTLVSQLCVYVRRVLGHICVHVCLCFILQESKRDGLRTVLVTSMCVHIYVVQ